MIGTGQHSGYGFVVSSTIVYNSLTAIWPHLNQKKSSIVAIHVMNLIEIIPICNEAQIICTRKSSTNRLSRIPALTNRIGFTCTGIPAFTQMFYEHGYINHNFWHIMPQDDTRKYLPGCVGPPGKKLINAPSMRSILIDIHKLMMNSDIFEHIFTYRISKTNCRLFFRDILFI